MEKYVKGYLSIYLNCVIEDLSFDSRKGEAYYARSLSLIINQRFR